MYTVLLLKFGRHLCKGSLTVAVDEWFCLFCLFFVGGGGGGGGRGAGLAQCPQRCGPVSAHIWVEFIGSLL